jgi:hypothetical protein
VYNIFLLPHVAVYLNSPLKLIDARALAVVDFQDDFRAFQGFSGPCIME